MNTKATIRKILFIAFCCCVGGGMLTLLIAAIGKKNKELCSNYTIDIKGNRSNFFIDEKDISKLLVAAVGSEIKGRKITSVNLRQLEQLLKDNIWIRDAEMWFDNRSVLHIVVNEREPVARIFTTAGKSFYIDSTRMMMPLSEKMSARVPVFTGYEEKKVLGKKDSLLLDDINKTAQFILNDPFWMSQVAQVDILPGGSFELVPVVGDHIVKLGNGKEIEKKFNRLMIFYKEIIAKRGFDVYSTIDVQYSGQVVGTKRGTEKKKVDTVMLRRNIENLLKQAQQMKNDSIVVSSPVTPNQMTNNIASENKPNSLGATSPQSNIPNTVKTESLPGNKASLPGQENKPKAVMSKKTNN